jgi:release factor glutamine methyltransferase
MESIKLVQKLSSVLSKENYDNPVQIIEELISFHMKCSCLEIYSKEIINLEKINDDFHRLLKKEPIQYIIGDVNFYGNTFKCDQRALIPRPETEILVETTIQSDSWKKDKISVLEIGTGTGCISICLAKSHPKILIDTIDVSSDALALAKENVLINKINQSVNFIHTNFLHFETDMTYDVIISNPPYISQNEWENVDPSVKYYEPKLALLGGIEGTEFINQLIVKSTKLLKKGGEIFLEVGYGQANKVKELLSLNGFKLINIKNDLNNIPRILSATYEK